MSPIGGGTPHSSQHERVRRLVALISGMADETPGARRRVAWLGPGSALGAAGAPHAVKRDHTPSVLGISVFGLRRRGVRRIADLRLHQVSDDLAAPVEHLDRVPEPVDVRAELHASDSVDFVAYPGPGRLAPTLVMIKGLGEIDPAFAHFTIIPDSADSATPEPTPSWDRAVGVIAC